MRRLSLHLVIALLAFLVGVTAARILGVTSGLHVGGSRGEAFHAAPPPPHYTAPRKYSCPGSRRMSEQQPLAPLPPLPPAPPAPPAAPQSTKDVRVVIRTPDGKVQVIESKTEPPARQF